MRPLPTADLQAARDAEYASAYKQWFASLPSAERAQLAAQGLDRPDTARHTSTRDNTTVLVRTRSSAMQPDHQIEENDDQVFAATHFPAVTPSPTTSATQSADILASFCARIRSHPNPLLAFDAACFASGLMDVEGLSETALAKRHRVTRAAFSRLVVQWSQTFGLPPSRGMRSKRARQSYRKSRLNHLAKSHLHHVH